MVAAWNPAARLEVIAGADHFFWSDLDRIEALVRDFLRTSNEEWFVKRGARLRHSHENKTYFL